MKQKSIIANAVESLKIPVEAKDELLDHVCCIAEDSMKKGMSFNEASQQAINTFGNQGLVDLRDGFRSISRPKRNLAAQLIISIFILAFCLIVFGIPHPPWTKNDWSGFYSL